jgi:hypothetical protein
VLNWTTQETGAPFYPTPKYLIINTALGGGWPSNPTNATQWPAVFKVDYVRLARAIPGAAPGPDAEGAALSEAAAEREGAAEGEPVEEPVAVGELQPVDVAVGEGEPAPVEEPVAVEELLPLDAPVLEAEEVPDWQPVDVAKGEADAVPVAEAGPVPVALAGALPEAAAVTEGRAEPVGAPLADALRVPGEFEREPFIGTDAFEWRHFEAREWSARLAFSSLGVARREMPPQFLGVAAGVCSRQGIAIDFSNDCDIRGAICRLGGSVGIGIAVGCSCPASE